MFSYLLFICVLLVILNVQSIEERYLREEAELGQKLLLKPGSPMMSSSSDYILSPNSYYKAQLDVDGDLKIFASTGVSSTGGTIWSADPMWTLSTYCASSNNCGQTYTPQTDVKLLFDAQINSGVIDGTQPPHGVHIQTSETNPKTLWTAGRGCPLGFTYYGLFIRDSGELILYCFVNNIFDSISFTDWQCTLESVIAAGLARPAWRSKTACTNGCLPNCGRQCEMNGPPPLCSSGSSSSKAQSTKKPSTSKPTQPTSRPTSKPSRPTSKPTSKPSHTKKPTRNPTKKPILNKQ